ncbi:biofilm development regulator YmgB/AriR family protein [Pantoea coffeiphila]|uniref:Two-component-system connector protein AriR n=1 Tax=Pantoea coffeiphila TaxID=1465635 RepID=A0A2S9I5Z0_9GAMM|nr:biofilm development regulator YmgB/AriR family protein [Pantoea coffeiphila]PRD13206.1 two-component-system connector protein AriR [Pantoea coffeiphila]
MNQIATKKPQIFHGASGTSLSEYFRTSGEALAEESALLGQVISSIIATDGHLTNKAIIARLIEILELTDNVVSADVVRKTLEIVLDHTVDDI